MHGGNGTERGAIRAADRRGRGHQVDLGDADQGALGGNYGSAQSINTHGEEQKKLDVATNEIFVQQCEWDGLLAAMASEEMESVYTIPQGYPRGDYLLAFDPLDGSSNIDINGVVGSIFRCCAI